MKNEIVFEDEFFFIVKTIKPVNRITDIYFVVSYSDKGTKLAEIRWHSAWREFAMFPCANTVWSSGCLEGVEAFLAKIMIEYKIERAKRKRQA